MIEIVVIVVANISSMVIVDDNYTSVVVVIVVRHHRHIHRHHRAHHHSHHHSASHASATAAAHTAAVAISTILVIAALSSVTVSAIRALLVNDSRLSRGSCLHNSSSRLLVNQYRLCLQGWISTFWCLSHLGITLSLSQLGVHWVHARLSLHLRLHLGLHLDRLGRHENPFLLIWGQSHKLLFLLGPHRLESLFHHGELLLLFWSQRWWQW